MPITFNSFLLLLYTRMCVCLWGTLIIHGSSFAHTRKFIAVYIYTLHRNCILSYGFFSKCIPLLTLLPSGSHQEEKDFNMEKAAKVFKDVFGDSSSEYFDLIQHLARSSTMGSREQWKRHAEAIRSELERSGKSFSVETASEDGTERIATRQSVEDVA